MRRCLLITVLSLFCVGCSSSPQLKVIKMWVSLPYVSPSGEAIREWAKKFRLRGAKLDLTFVQWDQFDEKLMTAIVSGEPPDVVVVDRFRVPEYAARRGFIMLDSFMKDGFFKPKQFFKATWNEVVFKGHVWAIPHHTDVRALYFRKDHFEEVGLDPTHPPSNWEELWNYTVKLTKFNPDGSLSRVGFFPLWGNSYIYLWGWLNGGEFVKYKHDKVLITADDPKIVEAVRYILKYQTFLGRDRLVNLSSRFGWGLEHPFLLGKVSMWIDVDLVVGLVRKYRPDLEDKYDIAPPPAPKGKKPITWSGGFALAIPRGAKNVRLAWEVIKHFCGYKGQLFFGKHAFRIPAMIKAATDDFFLKDPKYSKLVSLMKISRCRPVLPVGGYYWDRLNMAMEKIMAGEESPEEALARVRQDVQKKLNELIGGSL